MPPLPRASDCKIPDFTFQQTTAILRGAQGRVIREKGKMKAATEAVFFISGALPSLEYERAKFIRLKSLNQKSSPRRESLPPHQIVTANPAV